MSERGYFKNIRGLLVGRSFVQRQDSEFFSFKDAVERAMNQYNIPIIYNVDIGHVPPQFFIVNGSLATFEYKDGKGKLVQKLV